MRLRFGLSNVDDKDISFDISEEEELMIKLGEI